MFIAMNRFKVRPGAEEAFETVWRERDSQLKSVPGFVSFHLLRGPAHEDHTLYCSHSVWQSRQAFEDWTRSQAFRTAHRHAGDHRNLYVEGPQLELYDAVLSSGTD